MRFSKRLVVGLSATIALATLFPGTTATANAGGKSSSKSSKCWDWWPTERDFATKINGERSDDDVHRLQLDPQLSKVAKKHAREMARSDSLHHTPTDKLVNRVTNWTMLGENVGVGSSVKSLHKAFMNSPGHAANVLHSSFKYMGVGVAKKDGRMWVTMIFHATENPGTTLPMPSC